MHRTWQGVLLAVGVLGAFGCRSRPEAAPAPEAVRSPVERGRPETTAAASPLEGQDFVAEARLLFRVAACSGDEPLPPEIDAAAVEKHCAWLRSRMDAYRRTYLGEAASFLAGLRPRGLPSVVVYPFGGGDLLSALTTYPDASEITTLSLEHGGDPRRLRSLGRAQLESGLERLRHAVNQLLTLDDSASESLMREERGGLPGQLSFFLIGLAVHGQEPVSLRYFRLEPDGGVHYLSGDEIAGLEKRRARKLDAIWNAPEFSEAFSNLELTFRPAGAKPALPLRVHRHIAANLADRPLRENPALLRHLERKGRVAAMVKAASYLLWTDSFARIRAYLLSNSDFILSDSTGIPPRFAGPAGFVQETYGDFAGAFIPAGRKDTLAFRELWLSQPHRDLPFRYGYADVNKRPHLLVTRRPS